MSPRKCEWCGETFEPLTPWARFHSERCRNRAFRASQKREQSTLELALVAALAEVRAGREGAARRALRVALDAGADTQRTAARTAPGNVASPRSAATTAVGIPSPLRARQLPAPKRPVRKPGPARGPLLSRYERALEAGSTAAAIARALGLSDGSVLSRWRKGHGALSPATAAKLDTHVTGLGY